jgi:hypothetical protein
MLQGRLKFARGLAHVDNSSYLPHARHTDADEHVEELRTQLGRFRDHPDGSISGKGDDKQVLSAARRPIPELMHSDRHDDDDIAMGLFLATYWAFEILAVEALG